MYKILSSLAWIFCLVPLSWAQGDVSTAYESAADIPMEIFAQLPRLEQASISPDGRYLAIVYPVNGKATFTIFDLAKENAAPPRFINIGDVLINWIEWVNNDRLLIDYGYYTRSQWEWDRRKYYHSGLMSFDKDGSNAVKVANWEKGANIFGGRIEKTSINYFMETTDIVSFLPADPKHILLHVTLGWAKDYGVFKANVYSGEIEQVVEPVGDVSSWFADHDGNVRFGIEWDDDWLKFISRKTGETGWRQFKKTEAYEYQGFWPLGFDFDDKTLFLRTSKNAGKNVIYRFNIETGELEEKVFEHPIYDTQDLLVSRDQQKLIAASYIDDYPTLHFFDKDYEKFWNMISAALPGMQFSVIDGSADDRFKIIRSYSSTDPGVLYIYDEETKELSPIWEIMPGLPPALMSEVKQVTYEARDGLVIPGYLTVPRESDGKNLPTVILIHGGPWARDTMVFNPEVQFLASRGYVVFQPNFRGSSGFGEEFQAKGYGEWGKKMQTDITDGLQWLVDQGITDHNRVCIAGGSYGGYAALMGVINDPGLYKCAFAFAPVTDIHDLLSDARALGNARDFKKYVIPGMKKKEYKQITPLELAKNISVPVLLIHGDRDNIVHISHSREMAKALKKAKVDYEFITLKDAPHGIVEEHDRYTYFGKLEKFLAENLGTQ